MGWWICGVQSQGNRSSLCERRQNDRALGHFFLSIFHVTMHYYITFRIYLELRNLDPGKGRKIKFLSLLFHQKNNTNIGTVEHTPHLFSFKLSPLSQKSLPFSPEYCVSSLRTAFVSSISDGWQWWLYNALFSSEPRWMEKAIIFSNVTISQAFYIPPTDV